MGTKNLTPNTVYCIEIGILKQLYDQLFKLYTDKPH